MHKACPPSDSAPGEALRLDTAPPSAVFHSGGLEAPPAKLPVRTHEVRIVDGDIMVSESDEAPNLSPGLTPQGHV